MKHYNNDMDAIFSSSLTWRLYRSQVETYVSYYFADLCIALGLNTSH